MAEFIVAAICLIIWAGFVLFMLWIWDGWITPSVGWVLLFIGIGGLFLLFSWLIVVAAIFVIGALTAFVLSGID